MVIPFLLLSLAFLYGVAPQTTEATCGADYEWMDNSLSQSPCLVTAYLESACNIFPSADIPALNSGGTYYIPAGSDNMCLCNTIFYSLISACTICQNEQEDSWSTFITNCSMNYVDEFPQGLPSGTAVPSWGYLDVTISGSFDVAAAQALEEQSVPEFSSGGPAPTDSTKLSTTGRSISSTASHSSSSSTAEYAQTLPTSASSPISVSPSASVISSGRTKEKSNTGAIVGGAVGGIIGLIILAGVGYLLWLRHLEHLKRRSAPSAEFDNLNITRYSQPPPMPYQEKVYTPSVSATLSAPSLNQAMPSPELPLSPQRLYNPDDPSTYPDAPKYIVADTSAAYGMQSGQYRGAPEL